MPAPLIWLGAGLAALYATDQISKHNNKKQNRIRHYPGESDQPVRPTDGAIVCCGIFGVFDHTGIWLDGSIVELKGNGLIRAVSPERFIDNRSGEEIYVATDEYSVPLTSELTCERAADRLYQYSDYHVIDNNCHRFVWNCVSGTREKVTRFTELNEKLHCHFASPISWHKVQI